MKDLIFSNGDSQPSIGMGTWRLSSEEALPAIMEALEMGYRHIDCAAIYGNEKAIGKALQQAFSEGIVARKDLWITSKLWCNAHRKADVFPALEKTLDDLQLEYLDLYLMHWPIAMRSEHMHALATTTSGDVFLSLDEVPLAETWLAMKEAGADQNRVRHSGVSNFSVTKLGQIIRETGIKPAVNQVELHPFLQQPSLVRYCQEQGIHLTAYSPLAKGDHELMEHPVITQIANRHGCTPAQIVLAWNINRGVAVIPKSSNPQRLRENLESATIALSGEEMEEIHSVDRNHRYIAGTGFAWPECPYNYENVWDEPKP